jgi:hypothetical protein
MKSKVSVSGMDGHTSRSDEDSVSVHHFAPWPGTQEDVVQKSDSELGAGSESDSNTDIAISTKHSIPVSEDACAWIRSAFRKTGLEPVDRNVITPGGRALSADSSTCVIISPIYPISGMALEDHLRF